MAKKVANTETVEKTVVAPVVRESVIDTTKVTLKPIKKHGWLPDDHDGSLRYSKCFERLTVICNFLNLIKIFI